MQILDWFQEGIAPDPAGRKAFVKSQHSVKLPASGRSAWKMAIAVGFGVALIVFGWGLLLAALLYIASDDSLATWLLTALLLAAGHVLLAIVCWRYAATVWRQSRKPENAGDHRFRP